MGREEIISSFLKNSISGSFIRVQIPGDASSRSYERVKAKNKTYILMNYQNEVENTKKFINTTEIFQKTGVRVPEIYEKDVNNCLLLIEDLGDEKLSKILSNQFFNEVEFYRNSVNVLIHIYKNSIDEKFDLPEYSSDLLLSEALIFSDWYLPNFTSLKEKDRQSFKKEFKSIILSLAKSLKFKNNILIHRDFHVDNLIYQNSLEGVKNISLIDYQDAVIGNPSYDLLSLLEDARKDVSKFLQEDMIKYFIHQIGENDRKEDFLHDYNILAAIRNLKILGIFSRLKFRDKKDAYIKLFPRVKKYLKNDLTHPVLNDLNNLLKNIID